MKELLKIYQQRDFAVWINNMLFISAITKFASQQHISVIVSQTLIQKVCEKLEPSTGKFGSPK